jgi:predicted dehydrogenase
MSEEQISRHADDVSRRAFVGTGAALLAAGAVGCVSNAPEAGAPSAGRIPGQAPAQPFRTEPMETVRIGFVGVGGMGTVHVQNLVDIPGARITAVCDIREAHARRAAGIITSKGHPEPRLYTRGERDFERMCAEEDLDLVYTATPWEWHVPVALAAMGNGKHAASEVPFAMTVDDCWQIVETAERERRHCVMMENCNYDRPEMLALHMVRRGLLGEVLHGECGYLHDLREIKFADEGEGLWRREWAKTHNANLYPTHGLGPVANCMDINRGDRFDYIVSMSCPSRGLQAWAAEHYPAGHPKRGETYALGDVNTSLIRTVNGKTIFLSHDTNLPRPYSRIHLVQGTKGIIQGYPNRVYVEGRSEGHRWDTAEEWYDEFDHPMWKAIRDRASEFGGHGGMDFLEDYRLIQCLREGLPTDMNVYDAAALSSVVGLTRTSVANRSRPVDFPDFTRGRWKEYPPLGIIGI